MLLVRLHLVARVECCAAPAQPLQEAGRPASLHTPCHCADLGKSHAVAKHDTLLPDA